MLQALLIVPQDRRTIKCGTLGLSQGVPDPKTLITLGEQHGLGQYTYDFDSFGIDRAFVYVLSQLSSRDANAALQQTFDAREPAPLLHISR